MAIKRLCRIFYIINQAKTYYKKEESKHKIINNKGKYKMNSIKIKYVSNKN